MPLSILSINDLLRFKKDMNIFESEYYKKNANSFLINILMKPFSTFIKI